jgi:hypothetical protein
MAMKSWPSEHRGSPLDDVSAAEPQMGSAVADSLTQPAACRIPHDLHRHNENGSVRIGQPESFADSHAWRATGDATIRR